MGSKLDAIKMDFVENGDINFISRDSKNNGCVGTVRKYKDVEPFDEGLITVPLGGTFLLSGFVQPKKFYTAQNVAVLTPLRPMSLGAKLFYCKCISMNRFKYSAFGREANKTLKTLKVPEEVPSWVEEYVEKTSDLKKPFVEKDMSLENVKVGIFSYSELFTVEKGKRLVISQNSKKGNCPYVSSTGKNNGFTAMLDVKPNFPANTITVCYVGSIGEAFYQPNAYWGSDNVCVLLPKFNLNPFIAMFLITLIRMERFRFNYGRTWRKERMEKSVIKLPITNDGNPDWAFMENYIKSTPYSKSLSA